MAIIKRAKNLTINVKNDYTSISGSFTETAESIVIEVTNGNLSLISNKKIVVNAEKIIFGDYEPKKSIESEPIIERIFWKGQNESYISPIEREDIMLNHNIKLQIQLSNYTQGDTIELIVKQSKNRRIKEDNTEFIISGTANESGRVVIENFKVECDFKEDSQDFENIEFYYKETKVGELKENFGWTWIKDGGVTKVFVNMELDVTFLPAGCLESDIKQAMNDCFQRTLENSSNSTVTGKLFFNGMKTRELPQFVPLLAILKQINPNELGTCTLGYVTAYIQHYDNTELLSEIAETTVHELFHSVRLDHPFERTQSEDTKLFTERSSYKRYNTALSTDYNIYYNIMNYDNIFINGYLLKDLWFQKRPEYLTKGQLQLLFKEIEDQKQGAGTNCGIIVDEQLGISDITAYWDYDIPGTELRPERNFWNKKK